MKTRFNKRIQQLTIPASAMVLALGVLAPGQAAAEETVPGSQIDVPREVKDVIEEVTGGGDDKENEQQLKIGEIAAVVTAAHEAEIVEGRMAQTKASDGRVEDYADKMVEEHSDALSQAKEVFSRLGIDTNMNDISNSLRQESVKSAAALTIKFGSSFDKAYIDRQIQAHQKTLDVIDSTLLPSAKAAAQGKPELNDLVDRLNTMRTLEDGHLQEAKSIKQQL